MDEVFFLGDAVGYMPDARGVLERLRQEQIPCQLGNHEAFLLEPDTTSPEREAVYRLQAASQQLTPDLRAWIAGWPRRRTLVRAGRTLLLVHGSPTDELFGYVYPDSTLTPPASPADVIVMGNTHRPFIRAEGQTLWINVGSVGLPRDHGSLSAFAVYDAVEHSCQLWRVPLDTEETLKAYGGALHESVVECLHRSTPDALGTVIE